MAIFFQFYTLTRFCSGNKLLLLLLQIKLLADNQFIVNQFQKMFFGQIVSDFRETSGPGLCGMPFRPP